MTTSEAYRQGAAAELQRCIGILVALRRHSDDRDAQVLQKAEELMRNPAMSAWAVGRREAK